MWGLRGRYFSTPPSPCPHMQTRDIAIWAMYTFERADAILLAIEGTTIHMEGRCACQEGLKQHPISVEARPW